MIDLICNVGFFLGVGVFIYNIVGITVFINFYLNIIKLKIYNSRPNKINFKLKVKEKENNNLLKLYNEKPENKDDALLIWSIKKKYYKDTNENINDTTRQTNY